jgi:putative aldouronate transport system permease protein
MVGLASKRPLGKNNLYAVLKKNLKLHKYLYFMILPVVVYYVIFSYAPMYGLLMAFQDYSAGKGIWGSPWIGLQNFITFFNSPYFTRVTVNTLILNLYKLAFVFPVPILFALFLNELKNGIFKRTVQTVSYLPYFISIIVVAGIIKEFTSQSGIVTYIVKLLTGAQENMNLLTKPEYFRSIYIVSEIWQYMGFNSIIYISALSAVNPELYEAATIDGAGRLKRVIHITIPGMAPTIIILFILQLGRIMDLGFDKIFLLYNPSIYSTSDVIATYIYRQGLEKGQYSYSTAVGLFNTIVNFIILVIANAISRRAGDVSLF